MVIIESREIQSEAKQWNSWRGNKKTWDFDTSQYLVFFGNVDGMSTPSPILKIEISEFLDLSIFNNFFKK